MPDIQKTGRSLTRAIRIAFFVDRAESSHLALDAIFRYCFSIWGGRLNLIVPCDSGVPDPAYAGWLRRFDADLFYSYVNLTIEQQSKLHEEYYPSDILGHKLHGTDITDHSYRPDIRLGPLSVSTVIPALAYAGIQRDKSRLLLINEWWKEECRFIRDSFGRAEEVIESSTLQTLGEFASLLTVIDEKDLKKSQRHFGPQPETVATTAELLNRVAKDGRIKSASQLASFASNQADISDHEWSSSFNVIVGDSFADRLLYWNARLRFPQWRGGSTVDLCVPSKRLEDREFISALRAFINRENTVTRGGNGPGSTALRSVSKDQEELEEIQSRISTANSWVSYRAVKSDSSEACIPSEKTLAHAMVPIYVSGRFGQGGARWKKMRFSEEDARVDPHSPEHLRFAPASFLSPHTGAWAQDIAIGRGKSLSSQFYVEESMWRLPRRLRMTSSFLQRYELTDYMATVEPRVSLEGALILYANSASGSFHLNQPTDSDTIANAIYRGADWHPINYEDKLPQILSAVERSSNGNYFWGVLQLFGSLDSANTFLMHKFWRNQLVDLRALQPQSGSHQLILNTITKRLAQNKHDPMSPEFLDSVAALVERTADELKFNTKHIDWTILRARFREYRKDYWKKNPKQGSGNPADDHDYDMIERESLSRSLQSLCAKGIFHQGISHTCRKCHHVSWVSIESITGNITCEVCGHKVPAPVDKQWSFRLNQFLFDALRLHGIGPLFWALERLQGNRPSSFWFEGPLNIFRADSEKPNRQATDIDITAVSDGSVVMCEVKQSDRTLPIAAELAKTFALLRPDVGALAVMGPLNARITGVFDDLRSRLQGTNIKPRLLTFDESVDLNDYPHLDTI